MAMNEQKYKGLVLHLRKHQKDPDFDFGVEVRKWLTANSEDPIGDFLEIVERHPACAREVAKDDDPANADEWVNVVISRAWVYDYRCPLCGASIGCQEPDYHVIIWGRGPICDRCARRVMPEYHEMQQMWRRSRSGEENRCVSHPKPDLVH